MNASSSWLQSAASVHTRLQRDRRLRGTPPCSADRRDPARCRRNCSRAAAASPCRRRRRSCVAHTLGARRHQSAARRSARAVRLPVWLRQQPLHAPVATPEPIEGAFELARRFLDERQGEFVGAAIVAGPEEVDRVGHDRSPCALKRAAGLSPARAAGSQAARIRMVGSGSEGVAWYQKVAQDQSSAPFVQRHEWRSSAHCRWAKCPIAGSTPDSPLAEQRSACASDKIETAPVFIACRLPVRAVA